MSTNIAPRFVLPTLLVAAIVTGATPIVADPQTPPELPARLSETGLHAAGSQAVAAGVLPYSPQYPLWTDGAEKSRWILLPPGSTIDTRDLDSWQFPVGTRLWKEFRFGGRRVETRFLWRASEEQWLFATYVWDEEQNEALLAPEEGIRDLVQVADGKSFSIPGRLDCHACHVNGKSPVLGFSALQLSTDRDPLAPHAEPLRPGMVTLRELVEGGLLEPRREELLVDPPRIRADSPTARAAIGYLAANCGMCHNSRGPLATVGMDLDHSELAPEPEVAITTTVGQRSQFVIPSLGTEPALRIAPGSPEASAILYRMSSRRPSSQMPPLGSVLVDREAVELMRRWIGEELVAAH